MKTKFKIGDYIVSNTGTQSYIIVDISKKYKQYVCVDALCGREGIRGILIGEHSMFWACEDEFELCSNKRGPVVADEYVNQFNLPNEWKWSEYKKK